MSKQAEFKFDFEEKFDNLPHAPIVEAVIHWQATPTKTPEPKALFEELKQVLPDYPHAESQHEINIASQAGPDGTAVSQKAQWHGFKFQSENKLHIAQFTRNGFVFSRLKPYPDWPAFLEEANRLWKVYCKFTEPSKVPRLGVRFINLITPVGDPNDLGRLLTLPPKSPTKLPLPVSGFMHQTKYAIPGHKYELNVIQTIQPAAPPNADGHSLILDLDVYTTKPVPMNEKTLAEHLRKMRWVKDKAFFSLLKPKTIKEFRGK
ncbi:TIGR04255 family protein [Pirellulales bacterium]|nr:TIGR04255 family protein [Pirellulales bacterium]